MLILDSCQLSDAGYATGAIANRLLCLVRVLVVAVNLQFSLPWRGPSFDLGSMPFNGFLHNQFGFAGQTLGEFFFPQSAGKTRVNGE